MIQSPVCDLLHIQHPVFQGGMACISDAALAAAVSNAGGLGVIAAGNEQAETVRAEIKKTRALTAKPFALNIMLMSPFAAEIARVAEEEKVDVVITGAGIPEKYMQNEASNFDEETQKNFITSRENFWQI